MALNGRRAQAARNDVADAHRTRRPRERCLALMLDALDAYPADPLPGPPAVREEITRHWAR